MQILTKKLSINSLNFYKYRTTYPDNSYYIYLSTETSILRLF
jgi:hypothetical protein